MVLNHTLAPPIRRVVLISSLNGSKGSFHKVASGSGRSLGLGVDIVNTGKVEQLLSHRGSNQTSSSGGRHQSHLY